MAHTHHFLTALLALALLPAAQAASAAPGDLTWTGAGSAGIIGATGTVPLSAIGNSQFGFVSTAGSTVHNASPLLLRSEGEGNQTTNNGSKIVSGSFSALASDTLTLQFNYVSTDGRGYDDYAWARLVNAASNSTAAWLFSARSTNSARGNVVPGDVLKRQVDNKLPKELDATLNNGDSIGFNVASTAWEPLGGSSGYCWDSANTCGPSGWIRSDYTFANAGSYYLEFGVANWGDEAYDSALAFDFAGLQPGRFQNVTTIPAVPEPETAAMLLCGLALMASLVRRQHRARLA